MAKLTLIARFKAAEGKTDFLKSKLETLALLVKKEEGCIQYDLHQDNEDPSLFMLYETWASSELCDAHVVNTASVAFQTAAKEAMAEFSFNKLTLIA